jgi:hypothetical protein
MNTIVYCNTMVSIVILCYNNIILYYNIIILGDHRHMCSPSLTEKSLCGAYLYSASPLRDSLISHDMCLFAADVWRQLYWTSVWLCCCAEHIAIWTCTSVAFSDSTQHIRCVRSAIHIWESNRSYTVAANNVYSLARPIAFGSWPGFPYHNRNFPFFSSSVWGEILSFFPYSAFWHGYV